MLVFISVISRCMVDDISHYQAEINADVLH